MALSILHPIGLAIYGWSFHYKINLAAPLIGQAVLEPSVAAYLTAKKQNEAGAVAAANTFLNFCAAGIIVTTAVPMKNAMHMGPYFSLMCGINVVSIGLASIIVYKSIRCASRLTKQQNDPTPELKNPPSNENITKF